MLNITLLGKTLITILSITLILILPTSVFASDCDDLNKIALKCLDRRLTEVDLYRLGDCSEPKTKKVLIKQIMESQEFIARLILIMRLELLQGTTLDNLREELQDFDLILFTQPHNLEWATMESERLYKVYRLPGDYTSNKISFEDIYITYFNNWIYDQQNMGVDNFINTTFSYAIGRSPTKAEYLSAYNMVNDIESTLLYKGGSSKMDYLKILTSNYNFLEKQLKYWHYYFLYQYPDNKEIFAIFSELNKKNKEVTIINIIEYLITFKL